MVKFFLFISFVFAFLLFIYPMIGKSTASLVLINMPNEYELPRNFRMTSECVKKPVRKNLTELNASASAQFSAESLKKILSILPTTKVTLIDLREESHGFINGTAMCWYGTRGWSNRGKTLEKIMLDEFSKLAMTSKKSFLLAYKDKSYPQLVFPSDVYSEEALAHSLDVNYLRLPVTDHCRPCDEIVDQFVQFIKVMPEDMWLHFHCSAGKGRTTTFLAMYDIIRNAHDTPFDLIIKDQELLGGADLLAVPPDDFWKHEHAEQRAEFIRYFYQYCLENPTFDEPWSAWFEKKWAAIHE